VGREIVYCNQCGIRITEADFEKRRAVTVLGKNYCRTCMKTVIEKNAPADKVDQAFDERPVRKGSRENPSKGSGRSAGTTRGGAFGTGKVPLADKRGWLPHDRATRRFLLVSAIVLIVTLVVLVAVMTRGGGQR
jgi:hypothetical protein